jgi:WD40 repeat protein
LDLTLKGHEGPVNMVQFSSDEKFRGSASDDKSIRVWDRKAKKEAFILTGHSGGGPLMFAFPPREIPWHPVPKIGRSGCGISILNNFGPC